MKPIFVDTSAFVALASSKDRNHASARKLLRHLARTHQSLVTSTYVADEVITLVRMRIGHRAAVEAGRAILDSKWCRMLEIDENLREKAWELFRQYDDQVFSFTDCTSFAAMRDLRIQDAFTFDRTDFAAAGFSAVPTA